MEELQKALQDRGLTVTGLPEKGRCLYTTKDFYPGEVIISQEPYVCVPNNSSSISRCDGCFASSNLKKCSACQVVWYCGSNCQKLDWKLHRLECQVLSRLDKEKRKSVTPSIRLMLKLYLRRKLQNDNVIPSTATDNYSLVEALVARILFELIIWFNQFGLVLCFSYNKSLMPAFFNNLFGKDMSDIDEKQLLLYAQMANLVNLILQWPEISIKEIAENFSKLACNAHTICNSELRPLGTGLYPVISIINHSCLPNAVLVFEGRLAVVRAVQHVPKGAEVLISYIETAGSTMTRQKALKEQYLFTCTCPRCINLVTGARMMAAVASCFEILILMELEDWKEALAYCQLTIPVYQKNAIKSLTKAVEILRITHGTNSPFMKELILKLEEAQAEASYKLSSKDE
ncbi:Histone-lysine N-methyltransferase ASHR1 [Citrus sinensis]|uniref:Histone-lysine N-methyltransferase ASHR1 n=1 Tax=Citrus sinensis TaxID=2711 RepID=A0ACB8KQW7_CITSI|nr:Histone-lysine N-methyltransferase ASHR1 [Citrus sinensis]